MDLVAELSGVIDSLNAAGVQYAVCGGIALAIHGCPRFTQDIDLLVPSEELRRIESAVARVGFSIPGGRLTFAAGTPRAREIVRLSKSDGRDVLTLDLLLVEPSLSESWETRTQAEWRGQKLWVVSRSGLVSMKHLSARPQDLADIDCLSRQDRNG